MGKWQPFALLVRGRRRLRGVFVAAVGCAADVSFQRIANLATKHIFHHGIPHRIYAVVIAVGNLLDLRIRRIARPKVWTGSANAET